MDRFSNEFYVAVLLCPCVVINPEHNHGYTYYQKDKKNGYSGSDSEKIYECNNNKTKNEGP
jgi:hypothetical protein